MGTELGIKLGTSLDGFAQGLVQVGGDAEVVEALVCKTGLSGFESRRYLQFDPRLWVREGIRDNVSV